ncbi:MAG: hypothetical protein HZB57_00310 [Gammaproteobacteria bacterium]|nr:hypothetical protein [Gammaproteobacteria bacterium]
MAQTEISTGIDAEAGLPYWEIHAPGMSLRLVQRLPDQTRAFFLARGFARTDADVIARSCVFQTIFKNTSQTVRPSALEYNLRDWRVRVASAVRGLKTREDWAEAWASRGVPQAARIAFEWALLPTRQVYNPGDYNWGMSVFNLPPDSRFDLDVVWQQYGARRAEVLKDIHCAPDASTPIAPTPATPAATKAP